MKDLTNYREADGSIIYFEAHSSLKSTHELAKYYASEKGYPDRFVVYTERLRKSKVTTKANAEVEYDHGIFMSCILRPSIFPSQAAMLSAMAAVGLATGLEAHTDKPIGLGWISDVYCDGVKIGTASLEGKLDDFTTYEYIIVSFSVKINKEQFPPRLEDMVKSVFQKGKTSLNTVNMIMAKSILSNFLKFYQNLRTPQGFMDAYNEKFIFRGKKIKYYRDEKWKSHKVLGIDTRNGELILDNGAKPDIRVSSPTLIQNPKKVR